MKNRFLNRERKSKKFILKESLKCAQITPQNSLLHFLKKSKKKNKKLTIFTRVKMMLPAAMRCARWRHTNFNFAPAGA